MKSIMYKICFISMAFLLFSCADEFVDTTPTTSLPGETIITDLASAESALIGMYSALQFTRVYGGYDNFGPGLYADELVHTGSFPSFAEIGSNDPALNNFEVTNYWSTHYSAIFRANLIAQSVTNPDLGLTPEAVGRIGGQAKAARALMYYKLVKIYGGVPLITEAFTAATDIDNNPAPRASVSDIYNQIMADITAAVSELPDGGLGVYFFNKDAAQVFKAKIEMEMGNYPAAKASLAPVLAAGYALESDYASLFGDPSVGAGLVANANEGIFAIDFNETDGGNHAFFHLIAGRGEVGVSQQLVAAFEAGDVRINQISGNGEITKYGDAGNGDDDAYVFRYADVLLMQAEILGREDDPTASDFINQVRTRAGLGDIVLTSANVVDAIAQERFVEFFGESSDRLFTITRLGLADGIISAKPGSNFIAARNNLWPIPQQEIERNSAISDADQNPGY